MAVDTARWEGAEAMSEQEMQGEAEFDPRREGQQYEQRGQSWPWPRDVNWNIVYHIIQNGRDGKPECRENCPLQCRQYVREIQAKYWACG